MQFSKVPRRTVYLLLEDAFKSHITLVDDKIWCFLEEKGRGDSMIKKDLVIAVLATFCLTATLFMTVPTKSLLQYDVWRDIDDNGKIDMIDLWMVQQQYGAIGTPINKTELLLELQSKIDSLNSSLLNLEAYLETRMASQDALIADLQSKVNNLNASLLDSQMKTDNLNASLMQLQSTVDSLNATFNERTNDLETEIAILDATKLGKPNYDSGWYYLSAGSNVVLTHNLGTTNVLVYMIGKYSDSAAPYIHQVQYGGDDTSWYLWGAFWSELQTTTIRITRQRDDSNWNAIRVFIWKIPNA